MRGPDVGLVQETAEEAVSEAGKAVRAASLPARLIIALVAGLAVVAVLFTLKTSRIDWFGLTKKRAEHAEAKAETATDNAAARSQEVAGERQSAQRVEVVVREERRTTGALAQAIQQARTAPDANEPLPPDRAARLHAADQQLCLGSSLRGCEAAASPDAGARR